MNLQVRIGAAERKRLEAQMGNWDKLHAWFRAEPPTAATVEKMLRIEVEGRRRLYVATRLSGLYHNLLRAENHKKLLAALSAPGAL